MIKPYKIKILLFYFGFLASAWSFNIGIGTFRPLIITSLIYLLLFPKEVKVINRILLLLGVFLLISLVMSGIISGYFSLKSIGQIFFIIIVMLFMYNFFKSISLYKIYKYYIYMVIFITIGVLMQNLAYISKIGFLYNYEYLIPHYMVSPASFGLMRGHFILSEPATVSYILSLAASMSLFSLVFKQRLGNYQISTKSSILILIGYLSTFSSLGIMTLGLTSIYIIVLSIKKVKYFLFFIPLVIPVIYFLIFNEAFQERIDGILILWKGTYTYAAEMNISVWAIYSNALIAKYNALTYFPFGVGMGNHELSYHILSSLISIDGADTLRYNVQDAASLLLRILSEFGISGIILLLIFLYKNYNTNKAFFSIYILNKAFLISIIIILLRHGNYFFMETIFAFMGYLFSSNKALKIQREKN